MRFLTGEESRRSSLVGVGTQLVARAIAHVAARRTSDLRFGGTWSTVGRIAGLIHWLLIDAVPEEMQYALFQRAATPFALIREEQIARLTADLERAEAA